MKLRIDFLIVFIALFVSSFISYNSFAGLGDEHPNDVGSFGQGNNSPDQSSTFQSSTPFSSENTLPPAHEEKALDLQPPDDDVPLDGGASLLIAAGILLGSRQLKNKRKTEL